MDSHCKAVSRPLYTPRETIYTVDDLGGAEGIVRSFQLRDGIELVISDIFFRETIRVESFSDEAHMELSFCLDSSMIHTITDHYKRTPEQNGDCYLILSKGIHGVTELVGGTRSQKVELLINPQLWGIYAQEFWQYDTIEALEEGMYNNPFQVSLFQMSSDVRVILNQMLTCSYSGAMREMFLESKTYELMSICAMKWCGSSDKKVKSRRAVQLSRSDIESIYEACNLLIREMEQPPSVPELAKRVYLSDWKLKAGFHELLGTTIYAYLRECRLKEALRLMTREELNVHEAACAVGFSNPSHFAEAFRKKYGVNPREYVQNNVKGWIINF